MDESKVFPTVVNNPVGLMKMLETAVGPNNLRYLNQDISADWFKLREGVRTVNLELAEVFRKETKGDAAERLWRWGYNLEDIGELAQFLTDNSEEVKQYTQVVAIGQASRWTQEDGRIFVPCIRAKDTRRFFDLDVFHSPFDFRDQFGVNDRVLVSRRVE